MLSSFTIALLSVIEIMRRKEFYVLLILIAGLAGWMLILDVSTPGSGRFAKHIVMQVVWLTSIILAATLSARQIPSDIEQKSIYVLVSRPISRNQYVIGRILGSILASVTCFTVLFLVLISMLAIKGASNLADISLWQAYILQIAAISLICAITVFLSVVGTSAGAVTLMILIYAAMRYWGYIIPDKIMSQPVISKQILWIIYLAMPHFEFFDISQRVVHLWGPLPANVIIILVVYIIAYLAFISLIASQVFKKRWL